MLYIVCIFLFISIQPAGTGNNHRTRTGSNHPTGTGSNHATVTTNNHQADTGNNHPAIYSIIPGMATTTFFSSLSEQSQQCTHLLIIYYNNELLLTLWFILCIDDTITNKIDISMLWNVNTSRSYLLSRSSDMSCSCTIRRGNIVRSLLSDYA